MADPLSLLPPPTMPPPSAPLDSSLSDVEQLEIPSIDTVNNMDIENDIEQIAELATSLENHRLTCEQKGKYLEAEQAKLKLQQLRHLIAEKKKDDILLRQQEEVDDLRDYHSSELDNIINDWDQKERELNARLLKELEDIKALQREEEDTLTTEQEQLIETSRVRPSAALLDLRKIELTLAKASNYSEAAKIKRTPIYVRLLS
ncbi:hypothetical protein GEMRC1_005018 [Eukaryota sp. GEM-RC1]